MITTLILFQTAPLMTWPPFIECECCFDLRVQCLPWHGTLFRIKLCMYMHMLLLVWCFCLFSVWSVNSSQNSQAWLLWLLLYCCSYRTRLWQCVIVHSQGHALTVFLSYTIGPYCDSVSLLVCYCTVPCFGSVSLLSYRAMLWVCQCFIVM